ncbi:hypothetical protein [Shouchella miscanthi]|uniref:SagB/ThcOx family dehydrogenase n=1 Tax=Shouchella miscanthi TaxID=2598861 RepID=A0ABU6NRN4_9BACI|nr:hypothetical protein [Shouchella miscanthi]
MNNISKRRLEWDYLQDGAIGNDIINKIVKFNQESASLLSPNLQSTPYTHEILNWLEAVEWTDVLPEYFIEEISLHVDKVNFPSSVRNYVEWQIPNGVIAELLYNSFGRSTDLLSKSYASAGALYPVMPLLLVIDKNAIEGISKPGSYIYDGSNQKLLRLADWSSNETLNKVKSALCPKEKTFSNVAMAYSLDIRRSATKYRLRGYRHGLIEVGLMAQSFKTVLRKNKYGLAECIYSGYNDNLLTYLCGLNVRLAPIVGLQWFGKAKEGNEI